MLSYKVESIQNRSNEDFFVIDTLDKGYHLYAVIDGHGGGNEELRDLDDKHVALYVAQYLKKYLDHYLVAGGSRKTMIVEAFKKLDHDLYTRGATHGCTVNALIVTNDKLIFINLGDSRAIYFDKIGTLLFETDDHKPLKERERIESVGGKIVNKRVGGIYALSRSIGDFNQKLVDGKYSANGPMSAIPDVTILERRPGTIILGSDGVFDGFRSSDQVIKHHFDSPRDSHKRIVQYASKRNYDDDTTCIVVDV